MQTKDKDDHQPEEEKELIDIEELSQQLENTYKDMEQIRRENLLFESFIFRHQKDVPNEEDQEEKSKKKKKKDEKRLELTNEEKYEIAQFESEALKKNIDEGRIQSDAVLEMLRAILEETDMAITEIRKDAFDFQREILIGGENSRTGKIESEKIQAYFENKLRQKQTLIDKYTTKKVTLESQIMKTNAQIVKKDEMGDDLKFIDFHQLQIENKKYVKEIEEKNKKLLKLKLATGKISQILIEERGKLNKDIEKSEELKAAIKKKEKSVEKIARNMKDNKKENDKLTRDKKVLSKKLEAHQNKNANEEKAASTMSYVQTKKVVRDVQSDIKSLKRKIEITEKEYNKCRKEMYQQG